jgi:hypothetical protein
MENKQYRYREYVINDIYSNIRYYDEEIITGKPMIKFFGFSLSESSWNTFKSYVNGETIFYNMNVIRVWEELKKFLCNRYGLTEDETTSIFLNIDFKLCSDGEEREV